jgi:hypothetical protein
MARVRAGARVRVRMRALGPSLRLLGLEFRVRGWLWTYGGRFDCVPVRTGEGRPASKRPPGLIVMHVLRRKTFAPGRLSTMSVPGDMDMDMGSTWG